MATDRLVKAPYHRRTVWGDIKELAVSIAELGVIQPLICRYTMVNGFRVLEVVCGERRKLAAIEAKMTHVPVIIREYTDEEAIEVQASENLEREDLHPLDEGDYYQILLDMGHDVKSLAKKFQKPAQHIKERLSLRKLTATARAAYAAGKLTDLQAKTIALVPTPAQQTELTNACKAGALDDTTIAAYVRTKMLLPLDEVEWDLGDETMPGGSCSRCPKRTGAQREMFAGIAGTADLCTDGKCWRGKSDAVYELRVAQAHAAGLQVLGSDPALTFIALAGRRPTVIRSTGYVDVDDDCPIVPGKTWAAAIKAAELAPELVLARDTEGRARTLVAEKSVAPRLRKALVEAPVDAPTAGVDPARAEVRARREAEAKRERDLTMAILSAPPDFWLAEGAAHLVTLVRAHVSPATIRAVAKVADCQPDLLGVFPGMDDDVGTSHRVCAAIALLAAERGDDQLTSDLAAALERRGDQPTSALRAVAGE